MTGQEEYPRFISNRPCGNDKYEGKSQELEKERERKGKNGKIIKVAGCSPIREGVLLIRSDTTLADVCKFGEECQKTMGNPPPSRFSCTRTRDTGLVDNPKPGMQGEFPSR